MKRLKPPLKLPPLLIHMQWHRSREHDGATVWLRDLILRKSLELGYLTAEG